MTLHHFSLTLLCSCILFACAKSPNDSNHAESAPAVSKKQNDSSIATLPIDDKAVATYNAIAASDTESAQTDVDGYEYLYKSDNGENMTITFFDKDGKRFANLQRDGKPDMTLPQQTAWAKGAIYTKADTTLETQSNQAKLTVGDEIMTLSVISPLEYIYKSDNESVVITYFDKDDERFVSIKQDNKPKVTLKQTTAWAKGAEYANDNMQWRSEGNRGVLVVDDKEVVYTKVQ